MYSSHVRRKAVDAVAVDAPQVGEDRGLGDDSSVVHRHTIADEKGRGEVSRGRGVDVEWRRRCGRVG